ncbi:MAG: CDP-diacylglycerol--glycerol-3-phosphate 3-phosphatidyltransferase [Candidatus Cloacimonetes bacterium]|nr:CDP-diacylglycerol--glycerol-3-phosphate 3-phosphatidyltransferase [Candidatus Cloacimonadota bacterium]
MKKHIPNILTMFRVLLVPVFLWIVYISRLQDYQIWATAIFIVASITDYFDGMLARKFNVISNFGKIMDPLADKLLVISALAALFNPMGYIGLTVVLVIAAREIGITILRDHYIKKKIYIAANNWGKVKTVSQMVGIIAVLIYASVLHYFQLEASEVIKLIIRIYFWITAAITVFSGMNYIIVKKSKKN